MHPADVNLNLRRRLLPGLSALAGAPFLRVLLSPLRKRASPDAPLLVFSSYMIGDLFMALPALKRLAAQTEVRVICRPDCAEILRREGLRPVPFDNAFFTRRTPSAFFRTLRAAWRLRALPPSVALDLDADPRTALWLRIGGASRAISYRRPFGVLFDEVFDLPAHAVHQADRDMAVAEGYLKGREIKERSAFSHLSPPVSPVLEASTTGSPPWILSVWTRKPSKNWPLERWEEFMDRLREEGVSFAVLDAPDGDAAFKLFRARRAGGVAFVAGSLEEIAAQVRRSAGVIATDNFLGHMAGYYGKPVLWINIASPAAQVAPRAPRTQQVQAKDSRRPASLAVETVARAFAELRSA